MELDFEPETEDTLKGRFPEAMAPLYDAHKVMAGSQRPGELRRQVFDYFDGARLVVSREKVPDGNVYLHVSVSFRDKSCETKGNELLFQVVQKVNALRGNPWPGLMRAFATGGATHFVFPELPEWLKGAVVPQDPRWN